jgi:hypothetical protein
LALSGVTFIRTGPIQTKRVIEVRKKDQGGKVIYISFASVMLMYANVDFSSFLSKIIGIADNNKNLIFLVAAPVTGDSIGFENIKFY